MTSTATPFAELSAALGWSSPEREYTVERRHLESFLEAIGLSADPEPVAPPTFAACFLDTPPQLPQATGYGTGWLNGGDRFEYAAPLRIGDTVRSRMRFVDAVEKQGSRGPLAVLTFVTEFRRPDGELVLRHTGTRIRT